jgi:hypothetical protein
MTINPNPNLVEQLSEKLRAEWPSSAYAAGWMSAKAVQTARRHAEFCADCPTCHDLADLLSMVAAIQIDNPPPPELLERL